MWYNYKTTKEFFFESLLDFRWLIYFSFYLKSMFLLWICFLVRNRIIGWFDFSIKINRSVNNKFLQLSNRNIFQKNYCNTNLLDLEWKWIILYTKLDELCKWSKMSNYAQLSCNLKIGYVLPPPPSPSPKIISQIFWNILHILTVGKKIIHAQGKMDK